MYKIDLLVLMSVKVSSDAHAGF